MKITLFTLFRGAIIAILTSIAWFDAFAASDSPVDSTITIATRDAKHVFSIELARAPEEMERGLMFRDHLAPDHGMLFLYEDDRWVTFWMKNTLIPLDLIFVDAAGHIVGIAERTIPLSTELIPSERPVRAVLEVNGGTVDRLGIQIGDRVIHPAFPG